MRRILLLAVIALSSLQSHAQQVLSSKQMVEKARLTEAKDKKELDDYFAKHPETQRKIQLKDGEFAIAMYLDNSGKPVYYQVDNKQAAEGTKIDLVRDGISIGLPLNGSNVPLAVWDGGKIRDTHQEFVGRVEQKDAASTLSNHANHVTGTILATGVNSNAKGMAPLANAHNYDFGSDFSEMTLEANDGLILSNHSYGIRAGWSFSDGNWSWGGNVNISAIEDYKFGLYDSRSQAWDQLSHSNPYYLIVKSAGNHRSDTGPNNPEPSDAPPDGPFDILTNTATSKNVLTVGAIQKVVGNLNNPEDIEMSSFSSWGPTDDGRIKPDLCGVGVSVVSAASSGDNSYSQLSGTSMATPNVCGGLTLVQELAKLKNGDYLKSATLKGLAIHTVTPTGEDYGPDYMFGWGLFNADKAIKVLDFDPVDDQIAVLEETLANGATNEYTISLNAGDIFIATICWTDLPGPAETTAVLDPETLRLVHDLDMRIEEVSTGTTFNPYVINPASFNLSTGDNFRDNVEKIRFEAPSTGTYTIRVNHKSDLQTANQDFALIYSTEQSLASYAPLYFTGIDQDFDVLANFVDPDNNPASALPNNNTVLFIESDRTTESVATLDADLDVLALVVNGSNSKALEIDLNGHTIRTQRLLTNDIPVTFKNGKVLVASEAFGFASASIDGNEGLELEFDAPNLNIPKVWGASSVMISNGTITSTNTNIKTGTLTIASNVQASALSLDLEISTLFDNQSSQVTVTNALVNLNGSDVQFNSTSAFTSGTNLSITGTASINTLATFQQTSITEGGTVNFNDNFNTSQLSFLGTANVNIASGKTLTVNEATLNGSSIVSLSSTGSPNATFSYAGPKQCDVAINVENVDYDGNGKLVLGSTQTITNGSNWLQNACDEILEGNFRFENECAPGKVFFFDETDGNATGWSWTVTDGSATFNSTLQNPEFVLSNAGTYTVTLEVSNSIDSHTYTNDIIIKDNTLAIPTLSYQDGQILSSEVGTTYRWYHNEVLVAGATNRRLTPSEFTGTYRVEVFFLGCIISSDEVAFSVLGDDDEFINPNLRVYPNPIINGDLRIESNAKLIERIEVYSTTGRLLQQLSPKASNAVVNFEKLPKGLFLIHIFDGETTSVYKVIH